MDGSKETMEANMARPKCDELPITSQIVDQILMESCPELPIITSELPECETRDSVVESGESLWDAAHEYDTKKNADFFLLNAADEAKIIERYQNIIKPVKICLHKLPYHYKKLGCSSRGEDSLSSKLCVLKRKLKNCSVVLEDLHVLDSKCGSLKVDKISTQKVHCKTNVITNMKGLVIKDDSRNSIDSDLDVIVEDDKMCNDSFTLKWCEEDSNTQPFESLENQVTSKTCDVETGNGRNENQDNTDTIDKLPSNARSCLSHFANLDLHTNNDQLLECVSNVNVQTTLGEDNEQDTKIVVKMERLNIPIEIDQLNVNSSETNFEPKLASNQSKRNVKLETISSKIALKIKWKPCNLDALREQLYKDQQNIFCDIILYRFPVIYLRKLNPLVTTVILRKRKRIYCRKNIKRMRLNDSNSYVRGPRTKNVCRGNSEVISYPLARFDNFSEDEPKILKSEPDVKKKKIDTISKFKGCRKRFNRCRNCEACEKPNCRKCVYCLDMKKYGGAGILKQACKLRKCLNPKVPDVIKENQGPPVMLSDVENSHKSRKSSAYQKILMKYFGVSFTFKRKLSLKKRSFLKPVHPRHRGSANFRCYLASLSKLKEKDVKKSVITRRIFSRKLKRLTTSALVRKKLGRSSLSTANMSSKFTAPKPGCIWPFFRQDYGDEDIWSEGMTLVSDSPNPLLVGCYLCGCAGLEELIYCALCCEPFHTFCLNSDEIPNNFNSQNWCCKRCQYCSVCGMPHQLVTCYICQSAYHPECLGPNYPLPPSPEQKWCCLPCACCERCGSNVNLGITENRSDNYLLCSDCLKFTTDDPCLSCAKCFVSSRDLKVMKCSKCEKYVHNNCEGITDDMYNIMTSQINVDYECSNCLISKDSMGQWKQIILSKLNIGLEKVLELFLEILSSKQRLQWLENIDSSLKDLDSTAETKPTDQDEKRMEKLFTEEHNPDLNSSNCKSTEEHIYDMVSRNCKSTEEQIHDLVSSNCKSSEENNPDVVSSNRKSTEEHNRDLNSSNCKSTEENNFDVVSSNRKSTEEHNPDLNSSNCKSTEENNLDVVSCNCKSTEEHNRNLDSNNCISNENLCVEDHLHIIGGGQQIESLIETDKARFHSDDSKSSLYEKFKIEFDNSRLPFHLYKVKIKLKYNDYTNIVNFAEDTLEAMNDKLQTAFRSWEELVNDLLKCITNVFPWFEDNYKHYYARTDSILSGTVGSHILEHNYVQIQPIDPALKLGSQPSIYRMRSNYCSMPVPLASTFTRICALCRKTEEEYYKYGGRMLYCGKDDWVHVNCAVWSYDVIEEKNGSLKGVYSAIYRGSRTNCSTCGKIGATVRCHAPQCIACFHFVCALNSDVLLQEDGRVVCRDHIKMGDRQRVSDEVLFNKRRIFVDVNEAYTHKKCWKADVESSNVFILSGSLTVESLGEVCNASYYNSTLIPANFSCSRVYWSTSNPHKRVIYRCQALLVVPEVDEPKEVLEENNVTISHESSLTTIDDVGDQNNICVRIAMVPCGLDAEDVLTCDDVNARELDSSKEFQCDGTTDVMHKEDACSLNDAGPNVNDCHDILEADNLQMEMSVEDVNNAEVIVNNSLYTEVPIATDVTLLPFGTTNLDFNLMYSEDFQFHEGKTGSTYNLDGEKQILRACEDHYLQPCTGEDAPVTLLDETASLSANCNGVIEDTTNVIEDTTNVMEDTTYVMEDTNNVIEDTDGVIEDTDGVIESTNGRGTLINENYPLEFMKCYTEKLSNCLLPKCVTLRRVNVLKDEYLLHRNFDSGFTNRANNNTHVHFRRKTKSTASSNLFVNQNCCKSGNIHERCRVNNWEIQGSKSCRFSDKQLKWRHSATVPIRRNKGLVDNHCPELISRNVFSRVVHRRNCRDLGRIAANELAIVNDEMRDLDFLHSYGGVVSLPANIVDQQSTLTTQSMNNDVTQQSSFQFSRGCQTDDDAEIVPMSSYINCNQSYFNNLESRTVTHRRLRSNTKRINPLKCPKCRRVYKTDASFQRHIETCNFIIESSSSSEDEDNDELPLSSHEPTCSDLRTSYICETGTPMEAPEVSVGNVGTVVCSSSDAEAPFVPEPLSLIKLTQQKNSATVPRRRGRPRKYPLNNQIDSTNNPATRNISADSYGNIQFTQPSSLLYNDSCLYFRQNLVQPYLFKPDLAGSVSANSATYFNSSNEKPLSSGVPCSFTVPAIQFNLIPALQVSSIVQPCHANQVPMINTAYSEQPTNSFPLCSSVDLHSRNASEMVPQSVFQMVNDVAFPEPIQYLSSELPFQAQVSYLRLPSQFPSIICGESYPTASATYFVSSAASSQSPIEQSTLDLNYQLAVSQANNFVTLSNNTSNLNCSTKVLSNEMNLATPTSGINISKPNVLIEPANQGSNFESAIVTEDLVEDVHRNCVDNTKSFSCNASTCVNWTDKEAVLASKEAVSLDAVASSPNVVVPHLTFEITNDEGFRIQSDNIDEAWRTVAEIVQNGRSAIRSKRLAVDRISGLRMMGVTQSAVRYCLEQLPGARQCKNANLLYHEGKTPVEFLYNPSGCARCEPYKKRQRGPFHRCVFRQQRMPGFSGDRDGEDLSAKIINRRSSNGGSFRANVKESVSVFRSNIHGLGLLCKRNVEAGEQVMEYAGEVIRSIIADKREKHYESKGIGCYMFRIDSKEVVDATIHGNAARFINHSCEPNCFSKVITVDNKKHIGIFALRRIACGEELTYDYKFPIEDVKIPCTCGSRKCRRFLN